MTIQPRWMRGCLLIVLFVLGLSGCDYARMKEQEALQTYRTEMPMMPQGTVPVSGGFRITRGTNPGALRNPLVFSEASVDRGRIAYFYYCVMCHSPKADGNGTVGQSFYPLPTDLRGSSVQNQPEGKLFYTITFGLNRHPALGFMIDETDRWAIVHYIRSLPREPKG
jgi:mono/diheme cytochrome c family protein